MRESPAAQEAHDDPKAKALLVHERLCAAYECPVPYFHDLDPLGELVSSLLSHRTRNADSGRAFKGLRRRFPTWERVRDAPAAEVEQAVSAATWPEQKAPRIQQVLRLVTELRGGELSLEFLKEMTPADAQAWLRQLPGVGPKTAAAVLSFSSLRMPALPVDCHHHRVAQRLALIGPKVDVAAAHTVLAAQLPPDFTAQQIYDNHEVMMLHGQRCCYHANPDCRRCPVLDVCPTGQSLVNRTELKKPARPPREHGKGEPRASKTQEAPTARGTRRRSSTEGGGPTLF